MPSTITLKWNPYFVASEYRIYRSQEPITKANLPAVLVTLSGNETEYTDNVLDETTYFYVLAADNSESPVATTYTYASITSPTAEAGPPVVTFERESVNIVNPDFEIGNTSGWVMDGIVLGTPFGENSNASGFDGQYLYGGDSRARSTGYQDIALSEDVTNALGSIELAYEFKFDQKNLDGTESADAYLIFYDGEGSVVQTEPTAFSDPSSWVTRTKYGEIPVDAATVRIFIDMVRDAGSNNNVYMDNFALDVIPLSDFPVVELAPTAGAVSTNSTSNYSTKGNFWRADFPCQVSEITLEAHETVSGEVIVMAGDASTAGPELFRQSVSLTANVRQTITLSTPLEFAKDETFLMAFTRQGVSDQTSAQLIVLSNKSLEFSPLMRHLAGLRIRETDIQEGDSLTPFWHDREGNTFWFIWPTVGPIT